MKRKPNNRVLTAAIHPVKQAADGGDKARTEERRTKTQVGGLWGENPITLIVSSLHCRQVLQSVENICRAQPLAYSAGVVVQGTRASQRRGARLWRAPCQPSCPPPSQPSRRPPCQPHAGNKGKREWNTQVNKLLFIWREVSPFGRYKNEGKPKQGQRFWQNQSFLWKKNIF